MKSNGRSFPKVEPVQQNADADICDFLAVDRVTADVFSLTAVV